MPMLPKKKRRDRPELTGEMMLANESVESVPVGDISEHPRNPRRGDVESIKASIRANGFYGTIVVQRSSGRIVAGNHRYRAAKELGAAVVPVAYVDVDDTVADRMALADNKTSDLGGYDDAALYEMLEQFSDDLSGTGFSEGELGDLIKSLGVEQSEPLEPVDVDASLDDLVAKWATRRGQVWQVGSHRLMCGDSRNMDDVLKLMDGEKAEIVFTSPPYASQRVYDTDSDFEPIAEADYVEWWGPLQAAVRAVLSPSGSFFVNIKPNSSKEGRSLYVNDLVAAHARVWQWRFVDELIWTKHAMPGKWKDRLRNDFEPVYHFDAGESLVRHQNIVEKFEPTAADMNRDYSKANSIGPQGSMDNYKLGNKYPGNVMTISNEAHGTQHTATFPSGLPTFFIKAWSDRGDVVLDPFGGAATTVIACENEGRKCRSMEISPKYLAVQLERLELMGMLPVKIHG